MQTLPHNPDPKFVGIERIKSAQREELAKFEEAVSRQQWNKIHNSHYDWWMFPIDSPSSKGLQWSVYPGDIEELKRDPAYLRDYLRGVELLMVACGWDLEGQEFLPNLATDQQWQHWPVRLYKAAYSLWLFGYEREFTSLRKYALALLARGESLMYGVRDLEPFFLLGLDPYSKKQIYSPALFA